MNFTNHLVSDGTATVKSLPNPTSAQDAATKAYVDSAVEGLAWKDSVRAASVANVNTASPGTALDGVTLTNGDRVLLKDQTTASANGIYIWTASGSALTRAADCSTAVELEQAVVSVEEGTNAGTQWRQTAVNFTLDSGSVTWVAFGTSAPDASATTKGIVELATDAETNTGTDTARAVTPANLAQWTGGAKRYSTTIGDGSATSITVTHNLATEDVVVAVRLAGSTKDAVLADWRISSSNAVILTFAVAPSSSQLRVTVLA